MGHPLANAVGDSSAGECYFWVMTALLGPIGEVIRVHANAMPTDETRRERKKVQFVLAAARTSAVSMPSLAKIAESSFMKAMLKSR